MSDFLRIHLFPAGRAPCLDYGRRRTRHFLPGLYRLPPPCYNGLAAPGRPIKKKELMLMRDMTTGSPTGHLWRFALPLLLGNWLQLAYNAVDSIIAGRFIGKEALSAEGIAAPVMNLVILGISGVCIGAGVLMGEAFGARDLPRVRRALGSTLRFGLTFCLIVTTLGILLTPQLMGLLSVPEGIFHMTGIYLRITFLGAPFTFLYNALAAGLKAVGDTKTPLRFLAFSAILNALLDLFFLGVLHFGIVCSAVTTVVAEAASAGLAVWYMLRKIRELFPERKDFRRDLPLLRQILAYGGPTALQQMLQPIGKVLIQGQVNALGVDSIAAYNAVTKVDDFACIPAQGISASVSTFMAQNRGAGRKDRLLPGFRAGLRLELCYFVLICSAALLLREQFVRLFLKADDAPAIVSIGADYLGLMAFFYIYPALTNCMQGFFRGMGRMGITIVLTGIQITLRTVSTYVLAPRMGIRGIAVACAVGWSCMLIAAAVHYFRVKREVWGKASGIPV